MGTTSVSSKDKKNLDVQLNLMPVFDVLSVCICFLLMTVVWVQVGALETSQALGGQSAAETKERSSVWVTLRPNHDVEFSIRPQGEPRYSKVVKSINGQVRWTQVQSQIEKLKRKEPFSVVILPSQATKYEKVIQLMDQFKSAGMKEIGISPL